MRDGQVGAFDIAELPHWPYKQSGVLVGLLA